VRRISRRTWTLSTRLQSSRLLLCRGSRRFSSYVARQSKRPQPRGLFTRGQTGCLVFGHCFLTLEPPLFLLLENCLGSTACLMSVQRRYSFSGESTPADRPCLGWGPDAVCRCGVGQLSQRRSELFVPRRIAVLVLPPWPCNVSQRGALPFQAAFMGEGFIPEAVMSSRVTEQVSPHCSACSDEMRLTMIIPPVGNPYGLKVYACPKCGRSESCLTTAPPKVT
jgi:hypothetical protein